MSLEIQGKVKLLIDKQTFSSGFEKREFVVTTQEQYPQDVKFECIKDKIAMLDALTPGDLVNVAFNVRGNEYQGRYFVNLQAWKVDKQAQGAAPPAAGAPKAMDNIPAFEEPAGMDDEDDGLPF